MKKDGYIKGHSQRYFLNGAAPGAENVAAMGVFGECAAAEETVTAKSEAITEAAVVAEAATTAAKLSVDATNYEVINTDLLIIGAGFGAISAAYEAIAKGQRVTIVDKGPFRHSGCCGYNWDAIATWQAPDYYGSETRLGYVVNQEAFYNAVMTNPNPHGDLTFLNRGECLPRRNNDGSINYYIDIGAKKGVESVFPRNDLDTLASSPLVTIVDRTMVTDILINNNRCLGVMGIYLPTGAFRVYRAMATIMATGASCWFYGWNSVAAYTIGSPDNTGDVEMAAFRHGAGIGDSEYGAYDFATTYPEGLACGWNTILNPDANEYTSICDRDGNFMFTEDSGIDLQRITYDRPYFWQEIGKQVAAGRGTDEGGIKVNISNVELRHAIELNLPVFDEFGIDPYAEMLSAHDEMYEHGGTPVIDAKMMTDFEGFFCVRGAGVNGAGGGSNCHCNNLFGSYATRCAIESMNRAKPITEIDWTPVDKEYARLREIRTRKAKGGLRPHAVRHRIQETCFTCMGTYRETEKLEACMEELARIRKEDIPKMIISDQTQTYNTEWKEAIENYNLLDVAELTVKATLLRKETRGQYYRPDFPEKDNENWKCMLVATLQDGETVFEKKAMPEVEWPMTSKLI